MQVILNSLIDKRIFLLTSLIWSLFDDFSNNLKKIITFSNKRETIIETQNFTFQIIEINKLL